MLLAASTYQLPLYSRCPKTSDMQAVLHKLWLLRPAKRKLVILDNLSGMLEPGRLTLLLGPPSGGKSTFLKALAGQLQCTVPHVILSEYPKEIREAYERTD